MKPFVIDAKRFRLKVAQLPQVDEKGRHILRVDVFQTDSVRNGGGMVLLPVGVCTVGVEELRTFGRQIRTACDVLEGK